MDLATPNMFVRVGQSIQLYSPAPVVLANLRLFMQKKDGSPNAHEVDALIKFDQAMQMQNVRLADRRHAGVHAACQRAQGERAG